MSEAWVSIDGPTIAGKTTLADRLALGLDAVVLDTGLLYRAAAHVLSRMPSSPAEFGTDVEHRPASLGLPENGVRCGGAAGTSRTLCGTAGGRTMLSFSFDATPHTASTNPSGVVLVDDDLGGVVPGQDRPCPVVARPVAQTSRSPSPSWKNQESKLPRARKAGTGVNRASQCTWT
ncbi:(d)CMP kinase [Embleya sp. NPDC005575]|uniref:(d)CMP kinase n=1 Tax=Embleya sp. NPDC005575 TaxID=3156892 RepID=UPI0033A972BF